MPHRIQILPPHVVAQIAAGEVVQRPAAVVKELLENALDAGATTVEIQLQGLSGLTVRDNGCGMIDLKLALTRHATSKLSSSDDFETLQTLGFRGEALASVVAVAGTVTLTSRVPEATLASRSTARQGTIEEEIVSVARPPGTTVQVDDLFAQLPHRYKTMRPRDEYQQALKVVQAYSLHYPHVALSCSSNGKVDWNGRANSREDLAQLTLGGKKRSFIQLQSSHHESETFSYECEGLCTESPNQKRPFVLFCNHRLVDCPPLQRALQNVYQQHHKKAPWFYLSLQVPATHIDVNVHPTKRQVTLLYQTEIIQHLTTYVESLWQQSTTFATQEPIEEPPVKKAKLQTNLGIPAAPKAIPPSQKVRTTRASQVGAMEPFVQRKQHQDNCPQRDLSQPGAFASQCTCVTVRVTPPSRRYPKLEPSPCAYTSVQSLRDRIVQRAVPWPTEACLVGVLSRQESLLQIGSELVLWNHEQAAKELLAQIVWQRFGALQMATFPEPLNVTRLVSVALGETEDSDDLAGDVAACLIDKADMLKEYFAIDIGRDADDRVVLRGLPILMESHVPTLHGLPLFLLRLATQVEWTEERPCFYLIARELGAYYAEPPRKDVEAYVRHQLFPAVCAWLLPTEKHLGKPLVGLSKLYRVFERC